MDWLTNLFKGMSGKDWGSILGGLGSAYGSYKQGKMADELVKLQKQDYYDEKKRKKKTQARLDLAAHNLSGGSTANTNSTAPSLPLN